MHPTQHLEPGLDISPAEVLRLAAMYLARHGWHQGDMFADLDSPTPAACTQGAVKMAICGTAAVDRYTPEQGHLFDHAMAVLADHLDQPDWATTAEDYDGDDFDGATPSAAALVAQWNDSADVTAATVITALQAAADHWDTQHPGGTR